MATLTVWKFPTATGADEALYKLEDLQKAELITVHDGATVVWPEGAKKPKTKQLHSLAGLGALDGAFWGMLFGLLFFVPFLGMALGAGMGALAGSMADVGINDDFIKRVRESVTPGTSALFIMTSDAGPDRSQASFEGMDMELVSTNLSAEQEDKLRAAFSHEG